MIYDDKTRRKIISDLSQSMQQYNAKMRPVPEMGWLKFLRTNLNMPIDYIIHRMKKPIKKQSLIQFEKSEASKNISLKNLQEIADAMGFKLVYGLVPKTTIVNDKETEVTLFEILKEKLLETHPQGKHFNKLGFPHYRKEVIIDEVFEEMPKTIWKKGDNDVNASQINQKDPL